MVTVYQNAIGSTVINQNYGLFNSQFEQQQHILSANAGMLPFYFPLM